MDNLTILEQEELIKLQETNKELENTIKLKQAQLELDRQSKYNKTKETITRLDTSGDSSKTSIGIKILGTIVTPVGLATEGYHYFNTAKEEIFGTQFEQQEKTINKYYALAQEISQKEKDLTKVTDPKQYDEQSKELGKLREKLMAWLLMLMKFL